MGLRSPRKVQKFGAPRCHTSGAPSTTQQKAGRAKNLILLFCSSLQIELGGIDQQNQQLRSSVAIVEALDPPFSQYGCSLSQPFPTSGLEKGTGVGGQPIRVLAGLFL